MKSIKRWSIIFFHADDPSLCIRVETPLPCAMHLKRDIKVEYSGNLITRTSFETARRPPSPPENPLGLVAELKRCESYSYTRYTTTLGSAQRRNLVFGKNVEILLEWIFLRSLTHSFFAEKFKGTI